MNVNLTYIACFRMMRTMWRLNPRLLKQRSESTPRGPKRFKIRYGKIIVLREQENNRLDFVEFVGSRSVSDPHKKILRFRIQDPKMSIRIRIQGGKHKTRKITLTNLQLNLLK